jgi:hypothetical protein
LQRHLFLPLYRLRWRFDPFSSGNNCIPGFSVLNDGVTSDDQIPYAACVEMSQQIAEVGVDEHRRPLPAMHGRPSPRQPQTGHMRFQRLPERQIEGSIQILDPPRALDEDHTLHNDTPASTDDLLSRDDNVTAKVYR